MNLKKKLKTFGTWLTNVDGKLKQWMKRNPEWAFSILVCILTLAFLLFFLIPKSNTPTSEAITITHYVDVPVVMPCKEKEKKEKKRNETIATITSYSLKGTMANGEPVHEGAIACPRRIALGTTVEVEGMGEYVCKDRLSEKYDDRFDIWVPEYEQAILFGKRKLNVYWN